MLPLQAVSSIQNDSATAIMQDAVYVALTFIWEPRADMTANDVRRIAFLLVLCLPANAQPSPRIVDQIDFPKTVDLSASSWTDAFTTLNKILSREYPFTRWRRIDWPQIYVKYSSRIEDAERRNDLDAFRQILREYIYSFPDGHVQIHGRFDDLRYREIGGGFGFALTPLDDGRVVSYMVIDGSPSAKAGIQPGAEILSLDGKPIKDAALAVSVLWTRKPVSTSAQRRIEQFRYLSRATVGMSVEVVFRNPGEHAATGVTLASVDDHFAYLDRSQLPAPVQEQRRLFAHRVLDSGFGYIAVFGEDLKTMPQFETILQQMIDARVPALILDLRRNQGGDDTASARIPSYFQRHESLFEYAEYFDEDIGKFAILRSGTLYVTPRRPHFSGPVIALIGSGTGSSGEGVAMEIARAPRGRTLGFDATAGYFGIDGGTIKLPGQIEVDFPIGASLDSKRRIQLDSDYTGKGGVSPQVRVPRTYGNMLAIGRGQDVELQAAEGELTEMLEAR
jgi:carboxyl-terminal processing protease